jgi:DNA polymerase III epsilon subunit-like protein
MGGKTILRDHASTPQDPDAIALAVLGWVLSDEDRADRLIALTGITPDELRDRIGETVVLAEIIDFVLRHEPDLIACAEALNLPPTALEKAHRALAQTRPEEDWGA